MTCRPKNGGRYCVGHRVQYRSCNTHDCPPGTPDFRSQQCSAFDGKVIPSLPFFDRSVKWIPEYKDIPSNDLCKLHCSIKGVGSKYVLKEKVTDGTSCALINFFPNKTSSTHDNEDAICVNGKCVSAGCDQIFGSRLRRDSCGICGGDNSTCAYIRQSYRPTRARYGYSYAFVIPANSSNIIIRHEKKTNFDKKDPGNFLSLREPKTGSYLLNGNFVISLYPLFMYLSNDALVEYSGSSALLETIKIKHRIPHKLHVEILSMGITVPEITYEYSISRRDILQKRSSRLIISSMTTSMTTIRPSKPP